MGPHTIMFNDNWRYYGHLERFCFLLLVLKKKKNSLHQKEKKKTKRTSHDWKKNILRFRSPIVGVEKKSAPVWWQQSGKPRRGCAGAHLCAYRPRSAARLPCPPHSHTSTRQVHNTYTWKASKIRVYAALSGPAGREREPHRRDIDLPHAMRAPIEYPVFLFLFLSARVYTVRRV